ncbi:MAG: NADH-quinone oxidoreductase subunit C [Proteobacteria bacterium]|nr:NADH-quinone oxidoreductase subunit C [Pseudomonadota bacterium]MBU1058133.1 NADH-quinone oxidoreductase subunit C [Pseudomonadota bacterium]
MDNLLQIQNGQAVSRADIPDLDFPLFQQTVLDVTRHSGFVVQFFAYEDEQSTLKLIAVLRSGQMLYVTGCSLADEYPSFTPHCEKFHMFEREIAEQFGVRPTDHPWLKMVRYHENCRGKEDIFGNDYSQDIPGNYPYFTVDGEAIHEVAVGPVHAGIIEPGHFRFQCAGEKVFSLEIQLGYQHRGAEKLLEQAGQPLNRLPVIAESIAGDTAIGHSLCHSQAIEALAGLTVNDGAKIVRTIALELERIANHIGDLGALSGDVAFNPPMAYFGRIRGEFLNLTLTMAGNRFGKGLVRPGGIAFPVLAEHRQILRNKIADETPGIAHVCELLFSAHTVLARFEQTGTVPRHIAEKLGLVGYAGRASGLPYDARITFPTEAYNQVTINNNKKTVGDVFSRASVRREEVKRSLQIIPELLAKEINAEPVAVPASYSLAPDSFVVTINEAWRGEVSHCLLTDKDGSILRYKIKDPSFHNWTGLAMSLRNQGISDFPLCNKSFNLSYCGFDL